MSFKLAERNCKGREQISTIISTFANNLQLGLCHLVTKRDGWITHFQA